MSVLALVLVLLVSSVTSLSPCGTAASVVVQGGRVDGDGTRTADDGTRFPPGCSWKAADDVIVGCVGRAKPCLRKCCSAYEVLDAEDRCVQRRTTPVPLGGSFEVLYTSQCAHMSFTVEAKGDNFTLLKNGSLLVEVPEGGDVEVFPAGSFCQDTVEIQGSGKVKYLACYEQEDLDKPAKSSGVKFLINATGMIISLPFLLATLFVYAVIPELRNLHGKCLMSHVGSLFVGFLCLVVIQLGQWPPRTLSRNVCIASGFIAYFSLLASFFWLNVMCFDIWWTFSGYSSKIGPNDPRGNKKFVFYSLYAWGASVVLLCVCAAMQFSTGLPQKVPRPRFGEQTCWLNDNSATEWAYFHGPVAVLIVLNVLFFVLTARSLLKIKRQTAVLCQTADSQRSAQHKKNELRFKLYLKLFIVMGVSWSLETISTAVGGPEYIWWITDLANVLVGIPIFIIFVWKSKIRHLFMAKVNMRLAAKKGSASTAYEMTREDL